MLYGCDEQSAPSQRCKALRELGTLARGADGLAKYAEVNSLRMDIPKSDLAPDDVPQKGVNYFMINSYKYNDQAGRKALHQIVEDALRKSGKAQ